MALAGGPRTHSPGRRRRRRLGSWPRGSAHAQLLRPARGTHRRTPVARGLRAWPRAGCGAKRAPAVADLLPEATQPMPSARAAAATALRPKQPGAPPPAFRCRSLGNHRPQRYFRVGRKACASRPMGTETERGWLRSQKRPLAGRRETWTRGGTGAGPLASARLRPVNLRPEDYRSRNALLPPWRSRNPTPPGSVSTLGGRSARWDVWSSEGQGRILGSRFPRPHPPPPAASPSSVAQLFLPAGRE